MKFAGILFTGAIVLQASAFADEQTAVPEIRLPAETTADAAGEPEWYRQFSFSSDQGPTALFSPSSSEKWGLRWNQGERWSISIDRTSRDNIAPMLPLPREEMSAGAMFRLTSRLSVGGEISVGADSLAAEQLTAPDQENVEAGIKLRSAFRF